jgi:hypothetical protein
MKSAPFHCRTKWIGTEARRLLASPGFSGKVLAVVSKTIYLQSRTDEILWVVKGDLPMHRRSLLSSFPDSLFNLGERFSVRDSKLCIEEDRTIAFDQAREWNPKSIQPREAVPLALLAEKLKRLRTAIQMRGKYEGYGQVLPVISAIDSAMPSQPFIPDHLVSCGASDMMDVAQACLARDQTLAAQKARNLVGLGWGLTPSGDDFVGGLLFAFHILQNTYPEDFNGDRDAITDLIEWAQKKTNPISYTVLSDLALGQGPEPLHELVNALVMGRDLETAIAHINRLIEIGSTSGWDILTGFMTGMLLLIGPKLNRHLMHPIPTLTLPLKGREIDSFLPLQEGGQEGDGVGPRNINMSSQLWTH